MEANNKQGFAPASVLRAPSHGGSVTFAQRTASAGPELAEPREEGALEKTSSEGHSRVMASRRFH